MKDIFKFEPLYHLPDKTLLEDETYMHYNYEEYVWKFDNNYGLVAVYGRNTLGSERGLWECAVIHFYNEDLDWYPVSIKRGYCTITDINMFCKAIKKLPFSPLEEPEDFEPNMGLFGYNLNNL